MEQFLFFILLIFLSRFYSEITSRFLTYVSQTLSRNIQDPFDYLAFKTHCVRL